MADIQVRPIAAADMDAAGRAAREAYRAAGPMTDDYVAWVGTPADWVDGTTTTFVAVDDGEVVGIVGFVLPGDGEFEGALPPAGDAGFRFLAVHPDAQGRGAGRALVTACEHAAGEHGSRRIAIHSMEFMTAAHALYLSRGYVRRPDLDVVFPGGVGYGFHLDVAPDAADHFPPPGPAPDPVPWFEDAWGLTRE